MLETKEFFSHMTLGIMFISFGTWWLVLIGSWTSIRRRLLRRKVYDGEDRSWGKLLKSGKLDRCSLPLPCRVFQIISLEGLLKLIASIVGIVVTIAADTRSIVEIQYATVYLFFGLSGFADIVSCLDAAPPGADYFLLSLAYSVEAGVIYSRNTVPDSLEEVSQNVQIVEKLPNPCARCLVHPGEHFPPLGLLFMDDRRHRELPGVDKFRIILNLSSITLLKGKPQLAMDYAVLGLYAIMAPSSLRETCETNINLLLIIPNGEEKNTGTTNNHSPKDKIQNKFEDEIEIIGPSPEIFKKKSNASFKNLKAGATRPLCRQRGPLNLKKPGKRKAKAISPISSNSKRHSPQIKQSSGKKLKQTDIKKSLSPNIESKCAENKQLFVKCQASRNLLNSFNSQNTSNGHDFKNVNLANMEKLEMKSDQLSNEEKFSASVSRVTKLEPKKEFEDNKDIIDQDIYCMIQELEKEMHLKESNISISESDKVFYDKSNGYREMLRQHKFQRYTVVQIENGPQEIKLLLNSEASDEAVNCFLRGFWMSTSVKEGDIVHIEATFFQDKAIINDQSGLIIVNPDFLVSGTSVVSMLFCSRKAVLNEKFRGCDPGNPSMFYGTLIHQLFQKVIVEKVKNLKQVTEFMDDIVCCSKNLHEIYGHGLTEEDVKSQMKKYVPHIFAWSSKYLSNFQNNVDFEIKKIIDIEENYWCPNYGIKGKVDTTVAIHNKHKNLSQIVPLELKTGRPSFSSEHQGQVALYTMMMKHRYPLDVGDGMLLYIQDGVKMKQVLLDSNCKAGLIQQRNELMHFLTMNIPTKIDDIDCEQASFDNFLLPNLPEPINNSRACTKCPQLLNCALYQRSVEKIVHKNSHVMHNLVPTTLEHLDESHLMFFHRWYLLLHLELQKSHNASSVKRIWLCPAYEREQKGECFSSMKLTGSVVKISEGQFLHTFKRDVHHINVVPLPDVGLNAMDACIVSDQNDQKIALSSGIISEITFQHVKLILDRNLSSNLENYELLYRIEINNSFSTFSMNLTNLSLLMAPENSVLRSFIIDKVSPTFKTKLSKDIVIKGRPIFKHLNKPQQKAIFKTLMSENYVLIKGMPGTGKTSTIVSLIQILQLVNQTVLVTAYTHSAVDNILLKLKQEGFTDFVRLGKFSRIHKEIQPFSSETLTEKFTSVQELTKFYESKGVVATTCLGSNHVLFRRRKFDVCIVDEASQVLLPSCLGPLFHATKFVLVGDPKQLAPLVQNKVAEKLGMSECLFSRLYRESSAVDLHLQYRMNCEITRISNELTYDGCLQCGSEAIDRATLKLSPSLSIAETWLHDCFNEDMSKSVILLNTDSVPLPQCQDHHGYIYNSGEAEIVLQLCSNGVDQADVGIIAPYRRQVLLLKKSVCKNEMKDLEVNTVDQYQGREKQIIIISCVRTTLGDKSAAGILHDFRRLNVAITRAKQKLFIIGSKSTLMSLEPFKKLLSILHNEQIIDLPKSVIKNP
ncbi:DNA replication ATP-dependent helicase/nuclease DNA2 [Nymphon striatum]|nr:DNA replication ATP-dependent helicase/nuclease DNA2 [Nymphon striatum]